MTIVKTVLQTTLSKRILLKAIALFLGYQLWYSIGALVPITHPVTIPLCIYNQKKQYKIDVPESLSVTLRGSRKLLSLINYKELCAHIDGATLTPGTHYLHLSAADLLLPQEIALTHYTPVRVIVTLA
jgi:hypothetical protein